MSASETSELRQTLVRCWVITIVTYLYGETSLSENFSFAVFGNWKNKFAWTRRQIRTCWWERARSVIFWRSCSPPPSKKRNGEKKSEWWWRVSVTVCGYFGEKKNIFGREKVNDLCNSYELRIRLLAVCLWKFPSSTEIPDANRESCVKSSPNIPVLVGIPGGATGSPAVTT